MSTNVCNFMYICLQTLNNFLLFYQLMVEPSGLLRLKISGLLHNGEPSWASSMMSLLGLLMVSLPGLLMVSLPGLLHNGEPSWASIGEPSWASNGEPSWASLQRGAFLGF